MSVPFVVYFSTKSGNTRRFVEKLGFDSLALPVGKDQPTVARDYVLITPTYGGGYLSGAVPPAVIHFLNKEENRHHLKAVGSTGNTNFGSAFCLASSVIAKKCNVPRLSNVELFGTPHDVAVLQAEIKTLFAS